jgi:hypothetical protein
MTDGNRVETETPPDALPERTLRHLAVKTLTALERLLDADGLIIVNLGVEKVIRLTKQGSCPPPRMRTATGCRRSRSRSCGSWSACGLGLRPVPVPPRRLFLA